MLAVVVTNLLIEMAIQILILYSIMHLFGSHQLAQLIHGQIQQFLFLLLSI